MIDSVLSEENKMFRDAVRKFAEDKIAPNVKAWAFWFLRNIVVPGAQ